MLPRSSRRGNKVYEKIYYPVVTSQAKRASFSPETMNILLVLPDDQYVNKYRMN